MSFIDQITEALTPHADRLNQTIALTGQGLHTRLGSIQDAVSDLGHPDIGDTYRKLLISGKKKAESIHLAEVPQNEIWLIQYMVSGGQKEKSPAYKIFSNGILTLALAKEGEGQETYGGDIAFLPGENITFEAEEEGTFNVVIGVIRRKLPVIPMRTPAGIANESWSGKNVHDPARDIIISPNGVYQEVPPETVESK